MSLQALKIENRYKNPHRSKKMKAVKNQRNRKIRRTPIDKTPKLKYDGWFD